MKHIYQVSINGQPTFEYEARGVVSQQQGENQIRRLYGDDVLIVGYQTESDGVPNGGGGLFGGWW